MRFLSSRSIDSSEIGFVFKHTLTREALQRMYQNNSYNLLIQKINKHYNLNKFYEIIFAHPVFKWYQTTQT